MWDDLDVRQWEPLGPVATVDKKNLEIGAQLMSLLQEQIDGKIFNNGERRVVKPRPHHPALRFSRSAVAGSNAFADQLELFYKRSSGTLDVDLAGVAKDHHIVAIDRKAASIDRSGCHRAGRIGNPLGQAQPKFLVGSQ